ncbi:MAG: formate dehydrogenase [Myxococcales bacterium]|nr:formate dehydrogenase [Myxococcales bacterium]
MNTDKLVKMANEIAAFFEGEPQPDAVLEGIANHLCRFWDPRMRRELLALVDAGAAGALRPSVVQALGKHRARVEPGVSRPLTGQ